MGINDITIFFNSDRKPRFWNEKKQRKGQRTKSNQNATDGVNPMSPCLLSELASNNAYVEKYTPYNGESYFMSFF